MDRNFPIRSEKLDMLRGKGWWFCNIRNGHEGQKATAPSLFFSEPLVDLQLSQFSLIDELVSKTSVESVVSSHGEDTLKPVAIMAQVNSFGSSAMRALFLLLEAEAHLLASSWDPSPSTQDPDLPALAPLPPQALAETSTGARPEKHRCSFSAWSDLSAVSGSRK